MNALFDPTNSFIGLDDDVEELPLAIGTLDDHGGDQVTVLCCGQCDAQYALGPVVDDMRHLEMCPECVSSTIADFASS